MAAPEGHRLRPALSLLAKELRDLVRGNALWGCLLIVVLLAGYSYVQAIQLYGEASKAALGVPELARGLSPLDGVFVPTFGALYLATTFVFPFIAIRTIAAEKQSGSLLLLFQLPYSTAAIITAKFIACLGAWLLLAMPCLVALTFWFASGGHVGWLETSNLIAGHFLYGLIVIALSLVAAACSSQIANAGVIVLAATLGSWVLDFAAGGDDGLLKRLSGFSLTRLLRTFEQGIFSLAAVLSTLIAATALCTAAGIWLHPGRPLFRKGTLTLLLLVGAGAALAGSTHVRVFRDATENHRNSFAADDEAGLSAIDSPLRIEVHLAAEDPRFHDFERNILGKLRRVMPSVEVVLADQGFHRVLVGSGDDAYGLIVYSMNDRSEQSRSTSEDEVLPIIFGLAGRNRQHAAPDRDCPGYPLVADAETAEFTFYGILPILIAVSWGVLRFGVLFQPSRMPRS